MKQNLLKFTGMVCIGAAMFLSCTDAGEKAEPSVPVSTFSLDSVKDAITASNKVFGESFASGDSAKFINSYTSDACIYTSNMPKLCGADALTSFFNEGYKLGIRNIKLTTDEVSGGKEAVVESGIYELFADKDQVLDKGKYIVIWKEENGRWKMSRDIWNSDMPLTQPSAKK